MPVKVPALGEASASSAAAVPADHRGHRIAYLDGWRGLAILSVLVGHFVTARGLNLGRFGVELFFVLSGRLMAEILFVRKMPLRTFFPRRVSRIYPALFAFATIMMLIAIVRGTHDPTPIQYLSAITLTENYAQLYIGRSEVLDHVWSLCIEEHMYILLGFIALIDRKLRSLNITIVFGAIAILFMANGAIQTSFGLDYNAVYWRTDVRGASILVGAVAYLTMNDSVPDRLSSPWAPVLLGLGGLALNLNAVPDPIKYSLGTACLGSSLVLMHRAPAFLLNLLQSPLLIRFGIWSFSMYLWQQPFYKMSGGIGSRMLFLVPALGFALLSFYGIERPARAWINRLLRSGRGVPVAG